MHWVRDGVVDLDVWRESAAYLGATGLVCVHQLQTVEVSAPYKRDILPPMSFYQCGSLAKAEEEYASFEWVYVDPAGQCELNEFCHPTGDVVYAFGPDSMGFQPAKHYGVRIPPARNDGATLWSITAATVVLYDRLLRKGHAG